MNEEFLRLYNEELRELRKQGEDFADAHPKIAGRLRLGQGSVEDPLVGRLLESFAFLTARVRNKLDSGLDQVVDNITSLLYPHYLLPVPSCSTLQFTPKEQMEKALTIPAKTVIATEVEDVEPCYFTTCYPVKLWPLGVSNVNYQRKILVQPKKFTGKELKSCLSVTLESLHPEKSLDALDIDKLRFFIKSEAQSANQIYELLQKHTKEIVLDWDGAQGKTISVPADIIKPVGFGDDEGLLPYPAHSFSGFRVLSEFFAFPEKFFYFDLAGINKYLKPEMGNAVTLYFYFDTSLPDLEKVIVDETLALNCTPIVNVFSQVGEPITIDQRQTDYHVVADAHRGQEGIEPYMLESVEISSSHDEEIVCSPYFGNKYDSNARDKHLYWHAFRKGCWELGANFTPGYELFLSFSNIGYFQSLNDNIMVTPRLLCTNRDLPAQLPFGGDKPQLRFWRSNYELVKSMRCISPLTAPRYRDKNKVGSSDLAQHVFLSQICFADGQDTLEVLRNCLALYHYDNDYDNNMVSLGLVAVNTKMVTERHPESLRQGFCRGVELTLTIDEQYFPENNALLFGAVLQEFLTRSCSVNSFVKLILTSKQRGEIKRWRARLGVKPVL